MQKTIKNENHPSDCENIHNGNQATGSTLSIQIGLLDLTKRIS